MCTLRAEPDNQQESAIAAMRSTRIESGLFQIFIPQKRMPEMNVI
jgi:hypothetical protein